MRHTVIVTGIGGVVGQGIARHIIRSGYDIRVIGANIEAVSSGNHLCDRVYRVPFAYEKGYIERMRWIARREKADLIIPSTDYESYHLSGRVGGLPSVATSPRPFAALALDKLKTARAFASSGIPFAETMIPSAYDNRWPSTIVKPREGRGSRGIIQDPPNPGAFDDTNIVQKRYAGKEITTAFYVRKDGKLHGVITFLRDLYSGHTARATVTFDHEEEVRRIIRGMMRSFRIRGSCNIQAIVTKEGRVVPFEVNARISGTNSIRGHFGFDDVVWTLDEWLYRRSPKRAVITNGSAIRVLSDVIYPDLTDLSFATGKGIPHFTF